MTYQGEIQVQTSTHGQMHDLTDDVARIVSESKVCSGLIHIIIVGGTAAIGTIEFEPGLRQDLPAILDRLMPPDLATARPQRRSQAQPGHSRPMC